MTAHEITNTKEIYQETGGWPGCVSLMMRILERREETGEKISVAEVRECYEIAEYIESDILETLSKLEKDFLEIGTWCPWISKKMCGDIWNIPGSTEIIENLIRKGFLTESEKGRYSTAILFKKSFCKQVPEKKFWMLVGGWYESNHFIKEAFLCIKKSEDQTIFKEFAIRNYAKLPYINMGVEDFGEWKENLPELCFLRGMQCCFRQDIDGMDREIRRLEKQLDQTNDLKVKEIYLNLLYARPNFPLDLWMKLLEKNEKTDVSISLYNVLGGSDSYLCGLRDLSELFSCPRKEENNKMRVWKESLDEQAMEWYRRARKEYYIEINQEKCETFEKCDVSQVLRDSEEELALDVNEQNYGRFLQYGKAYLKMRQYEKAENIFEKLIPFLKLYHRNRFLAEVLFEQAVCTWEKGSHGQALRYVIESFLYSENARYVLFYTEYGKGGKERTVYLNERTNMYLQEYLQSRTDNNPALFVGLKSPHNRLSKAGIEDMIRRTGERAGVEKAHPHRFRGTSITNAINRGMPLQEASIMAGHAKTETTMLYCSVDQESVKYHHKKYLSA